jgi:long-chain acyl-CoA synthetase
MNLGKLLEIKAKEHPQGAAILFEEKVISFEELNKNVNRLANGLKSLGIEKGDRVAIMLPNIPEFVYTFLACQKIGSIAVPFNTMYKGGEIFYILKDCGAKALITLSSAVPLVNEVKPDLPSLEHIVTTGERNLTFADPDSTLFLQGVLSKRVFHDLEDAYRRSGEVFVKALMKLGLKGVWYKHRGSLRLGGRKLAGFSFFEVEDIYILNMVCLLTAFDPADFFSAIFLPPEVKDKVLEPLTSIQEELGRRPDDQEVREALLNALKKGFSITFKEGGLTEEEALACEKYRATATLPLGTGSGNHL